MMLIRACRCDPEDSGEASQLGSLDPLGSVFSNRGEQLIAAIAITSVGLIEPSDCEPSDCEPSDCEPSDCALASRFLSDHFHGSIA